LLVGQVHGRQMFFLACDPWGSCSIPRRGIIAVRWKSQATRDATASRPARAPNYWDRAMAFRAKRNGCLLRGNSVPYSVKLRVGLARPAADVRRGPVGQKPNSITDATAIALVDRLRPADMPCAQRLDSDIVGHSVNA
jgi:hypothetical protein